MPFVAEAASVIAAMRVAMCDRRELVQGRGR
jgi:hypothetical protein